MKEKPMGCFGKLFGARPRTPEDVQDSSGRLSFDVYIKDDDGTSPPHRQVSPGMIRRSRSSKAASLHPLLFAGPCSALSKPLGHNGKQYPIASSCRLGREPMKPSPPPRASSLGRDKKVISSASLSRDEASSNGRNNSGGFLQSDSGAVAVKTHLSYLFTSENPRNCGKEMKIERRVNAKNTKAGEEKYKRRHVCEATWFIPSYHRVESWREREGSRRIISSRKRISGDIDRARSSTAVFID